MSNEEIANGEPYSKCDKCDNEFLDEDLKSYDDWSLCATCEFVVDYVISHNVPIRNSMAPFYKQKTSN